MSSILLKIVCIAINLAFILTNDIPERIEVEEKDWKVNISNYKPTEWTADCITEECDPEAPIGIVFNRLDRRRERTCLKREKYKVTPYGYPLNPEGRTGIQGRGLLPRWGPNHLQNLVIMRTNSKQKEFLVRKVDGMYTFPQAYISYPSQMWHKDMTHIYNKLLMKNKITDEDRTKEIKRMAKRTKVTTVGSLPSALNTDNAWVEISLMLTKCANESIICKYAEEHFGNVGFEWKNKKQLRKQRNLFKSRESRHWHNIRSKDAKLYTAFCHESRRKVLVVTPILIIAAFLSFLSIAFIPFIPFAIEVAALAAVFTLVVAATAAVMTSVGILIHDQATRNII